MDPILTDFSTEALVRAIHMNMYELFWNVRASWKQAVFEETPKLRRWWSPIPFAYIINAVVSTQPPAVDEAELIAETVAFFQSRQRQLFDWWLYPELETSDWGRQLVAAGFQFYANLPGMAVELATLPEPAIPAGVKISQVTDAEMMTPLTKTFLVGYGLPPDWEADVRDLMLATLGGQIHSYLATVDGQPVATASVGLGAGVAGIYNVATIPAWRGKGIGSAITLHAAQQARSHGYRAGILQSSEMGYGVYQRLGFKEYCRIHQYAWRPPQA